MTKPREAQQSVERRSAYNGYSNKICVKMPNAIVASLIVRAVSKRFQLSASQAACGHV